MASISPVTGANQNVWQKLVVQQAEQKANQAEQTAQALRAQANQAQRTAEREQENARSLSVQSDQAQAKAGQIRQTVSNLNAENKIIDQAPKPLDKALSQQQVSGSSAQNKAVTPVAASTSTTVNAQGQVTGKIISVTA
jgi:hypothetical protein